MKTGEVYAADKLYLYLSADGVTRQRCGRHVHQERWGHPVRIWLVQRPSKRHTCIECKFQSPVGILEVSRNIPPGPLEKQAKEQEHEDRSEPIVQHG